MKVPSRLPELSGGILTFEVFTWVIEFPLYVQNPAPKLEAGLTYDIPRLWVVVVSFQTGNKRCDYHYGNENVHGSIGLGFSSFDSYALNTNLHGWLTLIHAN